MAMAWPWRGRVAAPQVAERIRKEQFKHTGSFGISVLVDAVAWSNVYGDAIERLLEENSRCTDRENEKNSNADSR